MRRGQSEDPAETIVAEATDNEELWADLLNDADLGSGRCSLPDSALIHARRGRYLFWRDQSKAAAAEFRFGVERGCRAQVWDDAAAWCRSIITVHTRASEVNVTEVENLQQQIRAISASGRGALRIQAYDPEVAALQDLLEAAVGRKRPRAARAELRRYLRDSVASAHLVDEIQAHVLMGRMYQQSGHLERAVSHYISPAGQTTAVRLPDSLAATLTAAANRRHFSSSAGQLPTAPQPARLT